MQYQVFVHTNAANHFTAEVLGVPNCVVEGTTKEEALANAKAALTERIAQGEFVTIEVETPAHLHNPLLKHAGRFKDDPTYDAVLAEIEKYRRELDAELGHP